MHRTLALVAGALALAACTAADAQAPAPATTAAADECGYLTVDVTVRPLAVLAHFRDAPEGTVRKHEGDLFLAHCAADALYHRLDAPAVRAQLADVTADPDVTLTEHPDHDHITGLSPLQPSDLSFGWPPAQAKALLDIYASHHHH